MLAKYIYIYIYKTGIRVLVSIDRLDFTQPASKNFSLADNIREVKSRRGQTTPRMFNLGYYCFFFLPFLHQTCQKPSACHQVNLECCLTLNVKLCRHNA